MKEQKERPYCGIRLKLTKLTVWPRNGHTLENSTEKI